MGRRKIRLTRSGGTVEAHYYATVPSGVTIDGVNKRMDIGSIYATDFSGTSYVGKVDFGQGTAYKLYMGSHLIATKTDIAWSGTTLSDGTMQFTTGLTTVNAFVCSFQDSAVSPGHHGYPEDIHWTRGYISAGGVTVFLNSTIDGISWEGCTPARTVGWSGCTLNWMAMGT